MFRRKIYQKLLEWKRLSDGKTAALIEGARRIGKSTTAEEFAKNEYEDYLVLDFSQESQDIRQNFIENISDMDDFFRMLFLIKGRSLSRGNAVIILDEIQLFPIARQAVKQLVADGRYHYIETGSLISIRQNTKDILIPSEEYRIRMYPMDFEEFLWAHGNNVAANEIRDRFDSLEPMGETAHRKIMKDLRTYMAVGGMPQAVASHVEGEEFEQIDFVKQSILSLYQEDLHKYDIDERLKTSAVFNSIPTQLRNRNCRFKYSLVDKNQKHSRLSSTIDFLKESMLVNLCIDVTKPDVFLDMYLKEDTFKMFLGDTGLLVTQSMLRSGAGNNDLYRALVIDKSDADLGMFYENLVAQMLAANGHDLRFCEFKYAGPRKSEGSDEAKEKDYEIDFLLTYNRRVCPIEVKSSSYRAHKSLDNFFEKFQGELGEMDEGDPGEAIYGFIGKFDVRTRKSYVIYTKDLQRSEKTIYIPAYMAMCL